MKITTVGWPQAQGVWCFFLARRTHSRALRSINCSRTLSNCRKEEEEKKRKQTTNQQQKQRKRKTSVGRLHEQWQFFHHFLSLEGKDALYRLRAYRKAIIKTQRRSPLQILCKVREAKDIFRKYSVFRRVFSQNCFLLYFSFFFISVSVWQLQRIPC